MAQPKSFTKAGIVFAVGDWLRFDDVLVQASGANELPYICKILSIEGPCTTEEGEPGNNLRVNWYYRPEDIERKVGSNQYLTIALQPCKHPPPANKNQQKQHLFSLCSHSTVDKNSSYQTT